MSVHIGGSRRRGDESDDGDGGGASGGNLKKKKRTVSPASPSSSAFADPLVAYERELSALEDDYTGELSALELANRWGALTNEFSLPSTVGGGGVQDGMFGDTPAHHAARRGSKQFLIMLVEVRGKGAREKHIRCTVWVYSSVL